MIMFCIVATLFFFCAALVHEGILEPKFAAVFCCVSILLLVVSLPTHFYLRSTNQGTIAMYTEYKAHPEYSISKDVMDSLGREIVTLKIDNKTMWSGPHIPDCVDTVKVDSLGGIH